MSVMMIICFVIVVFCSICALIYQRGSAVCISERRLEGRSAVVTGGSSGMGLQVAMELARRGARVTVAARAEDGALQAMRAAAPRNPHLYFHHLNLASFASVRQFAAYVNTTHSNLHLLINNAGTGGPHRKTADGLNLVMQVNYYGAFLLTFLLLPMLKKSGSIEDPSRIVNLSSPSYVLGREYFERMGLSSLPFLSYFNSKLYLTMFSRELARRLRGSNVVVNSVDPGIVATSIHNTFLSFLSLFDFLFRRLFKTPWQGAQTTLHVALADEASKVSGQLFKDCKIIETSSIALDEQQAVRLWNKTIDLVKLTNTELIL